MLNRIPEGMRRAARTVAMNNPSAIECQVYRKIITRTEGAEAGEFGGQPTLGGLGVLTNEEEEEVDYHPIGDAKVLFVEQYQPTKLHDTRDSSDARAESDALIVPVVENSFDLKDGDLVMVMPGAGIVIPYEVISVVSTVEIPPYVPKVRLAAQGDLDYSLLS